MRRVPKVSVIIPFYNRKRHIRDCLTSVRKSSLKAIEIICVDDGSTDDTYDYLCGIAARDKRITVIKAEHRGPYEARWTGLRSARGEYIHFMDSDDTIDVDAYRDGYQVCKDNDLDYLVFRCEPFVNENNNEREEATRQSFARHYTLSDACCGKAVGGMELMRMMMCEKCFYVGLPMRMIRRSVITEEDFGLCRAFYHADNFYSVVWLARARRAMAVNRKFYNRRVHRNSISMNKCVEEMHIRSILLVIAAFCRSIANGIGLGGQESSYLVRLSRGLNRHSAAMSDEELGRIVDETLADESPEYRCLVRHLFFPLCRKLMK